MVGIEIYKRRGQTLCRPWEGEYFIPWGLAHLPVGTCCLSNRSWESCQDSLVSQPGSWDMKSTKEKCATSLPPLSIPFPPHFSSDLLAPVCGPARPHCPSYIYSYLTFTPRSKKNPQKVSQSVHSAWKYSLSQRRLYWIILHKFLVSAESTHSGVDQQ